MTIWLTDFRPFPIRMDAREGLARLGAGLSTDEFIDKVWASRIEEMPPRKKPRSRTWPKSCRMPNKGPFVVPERKSNVLPIKRVKKQ